MSELRDVAHFMFGRGFWYADPLREFHGLDEKQLFWTPDRNCMCLLWHAGHIAYRECQHLGQFRPESIVYKAPRPYEVFDKWSSVRDVRGAGDYMDIFNWVRDVRDESHSFIDDIKEKWHTEQPDAKDGLSIASWVFITAAHTAEHIGRIKHMKAMLLSKPEEPC